MKKNIAIITARSGSKGLVHKNIKPLLGKPMLAYSIEAALKSGLFDEVMVSTDSEEYAQIARKFGANVPFLRSEENASDTASSWDVVREILDKYMGDMGRIFDTVCLLQPTSPLRTEEDIVNAYKLFEEKKANAVFGVCEMEHSPLWSNVLPDDLSMDEFIPLGNQKQRQQLKKYYRINGAVYIVCTDTIIKKDNIYNNSYGYIMDQKRSIDIDTELDFLIAETVMRN